MEPTPSPTPDARVQAIRADALVGRGSCTELDECWSNEYLIKQLDDAAICHHAPAFAVKWAHKQQQFYLEISLNYSSGEPDCPLRAAYDEWMAAVEVYHMVCKDCGVGNGPAPKDSWDVSDERGPFEEIPLCSECADIRFQRAGEMPRGWEMENIDDEMYP